MVSEALAIVGASHSNSGGRLWLIFAVLNFGDCKNLHNFLVTRTTWLKIFRYDLTQSLNRIRPISMRDRCKGQIGFIKVIRDSWYSSEAKHCNCKQQVEINALSRSLVGQYVC